MSAWRFIKLSWTLVQEAGMEVGRERPLSSNCHIHEPINKKTTLRACWLEIINNSNHLIFLTRLEVGRWALMIWAGLVWCLVGLLIGLKLDTRLAGAGWSGRDLAGMTPHVPLASLHMFSGQKQSSEKGKGKVHVLFSRICLSQALLFPFGWSMSHGQALHHCGRVLSKVWV